MEKLSNIEDQSNEMIKQLQAMEVNTKKDEMEKEKQEMKTREPFLDTKLIQQGHHIYQEEEVRSPYEGCL